MLSTNVEFQQALNYFNNNQFKKSFLKLIKISPEFSKNIQFLKLLSQVQRQIGDVSGMIKTLMTIANISQDFSDKLDYFESLVDHERRNEALDMMLTVDKSKLEMMNQLRINLIFLKLYTLENDFEGMQEVCSEFKLHNFSNAEIQYCESILNYHRGLSDESLQNLRQLISYYGHFDQGWVALALHHYQLGDAELAKANLHKALDLNPKNKVAIKYLSQWSQGSDEINSAISKVNFYLSDKCFDEEMTLCQISLFNKNGQTDLAQFEQKKLAYYFGQAL